MVYRVHWTEPTHELCVRHVACGMWHDHDKFTFEGRAWLRGVTTTRAVNRYRSDVSTLSDEAMFGFAQWRRNYEYMNSNCNLSFFLPVSFSPFFSLFVSPQIQR